MHYSKVKREKQGPCNLCRKEAGLTWDHVPPQGGIELSSMEMRTILETLSGDPDKDKYRITQNGVKYRTLCKACNEWLGQEFDPVLNKFANDVALLVRSPLHLPPILEVETKPHRLIRAILGHLVAAKSELDDVVFDQQVRNYIFDQSAPLPGEISIFYWIYPYPIQVVIRDVGMPSTRGNYSDFMFCQILKYFPVAYMVSTADEYEGLAKLTQYRDAKLDEIMRLPIGLRNVPNQHWPEAPDKGNILFGGQAMESSVIGSPRKR